MFSTICISTTSAKPCRRYAYLQKLKRGGTTPSLAGVPMTKPDILTPLQKTCLTTLFSDAWFRRYFYLTGGTALAAFYLYHRLSDDLDFFCHDIDLKAIPP